LLPRRFSPRRQARDLSAQLHPGRAKLSRPRSHPISHHTRREAALFNPLRHIGIALDENEVPHVVAEWGDEAAAINHRLRAWARTDLGNWQMLLNEEASGTDDF